jgi:hypothetical protein
MTTVPLQEKRTEFIKDIARKVFFKRKRQDTLEQVESVLF